MPLLLTALVMLLAGGVAVSRDESGRTGVSPSGRLLVKHSIHNGVHQIWLIDRRSPSKRVVLYEHNRHAEVLFSPDERWVAITDYYFSNESEVLLFRRRRGLEFERLEAVNIREKAWRFFARQHGMADVGPHHSYVKAVGWERDSSAVLIRLEGYGEKHSLDPWLFTFDVRTLEPRAYRRGANPRAYKKIKGRRRAGRRRLTTARSGRAYRQLS